MTTLTAAQQDYIETLYRLKTREPKRAIRICDIAAELGTRLPTVTRTIRRLTALGLVLHDERREVRLTGQGERIARDIVHRHDDLVQFFTEILGLSRAEAENDACRAEHGISGKAARRLHEFLEQFAGMSAEEQQRLTAFRRALGSSFTGFRTLGDAKPNGWRS